MDRRLLPPDEPITRSPNHPARQSLCRPMITSRRSYVTLVTRSHRLGVTE